MTFICTVDDPNLLSSGKDMANSESEPSSEESGQLTAGIQGSCITEDLSASVMISSVTEVSLDKTVCPLTGTFIQSRSLDLHILFLLIA